MAKQNRTTLKGYFETGDIPNQNQYADLIDSNLNLSENNTGNIQLTGEITASGNISASGNIEVSGLNSSGDISCSGNSSCNGSFSCDGNISSSADVISNNITATNITASGNISASGGGFFGGDVQLDNNQALIGKKLNNVTMNLAKVNSSGLIFLGDSLTNTTYVEGQDIIIGKSSATSLTTVLNDFKVNGNITGSGNLKIAGNISASGNAIIEGHITASGNISASGNIVANRLESLTNLLIGNNYKILPVNDGSIGTFPFIHFNEDNLDLSTAQGEYINLSDNVSVNSTLTVGSNLTVNGAQVNFSNLPTSDPGVAGRLWNDSGTLKISAG